MGGRPLALLANGALLLLGATWLWVRLSSRNLCVYVETERPVLTSADAVGVRVRLNNEGFLPVPRVRVTAAPGCRPAFDAVLEGRVPALGTSSARMGPLRLPRGAYRLGPVEVEVRDPLGVWRVTSRSEGDRVTVYPRVLPLEAMPAPPGRSFGRVRTRRPSQEDFSNLVEIRAFQPGDNPRLIDWKATARRGSWQVRVLEEGAVAEVWLFLDGTAEAGVEVAASLARHLLLSGSLVGLVGQASPPVAVAPGRGEARWREVMQGLLRVEPSGLPVAQLLGARQASLPRGATVMVVAPALDAALFDRLLRVRQVVSAAGLILVPPDSAGGTAAPAGEAARAGGAVAPAGEAAPAGVSDARLEFLRRKGVTVLAAHLAGDPPRWRLGGAVAGAVTPQGRAAAVSGVAGVAGGTG